MKFLTAALLASAALVLCLSAPRAQDDKELSIKYVMKKGHAKTGLLNKVASGEATAEEKKELVKLYTTLAKAKPPKGSQEDWNERTSKIVAAAKAAETDPDAAKSLKKVVNCAGCHKLHKP